MLSVCLGIHPKVLGFAHLLLEEGYSRPDGDKVCPDPSLSLLFLSVGVFRVPNCLVGSLFTGCSLALWSYTLALCQDTHPARGWGSLRLALSRLLTNMHQHVKVWLAEPAQLPPGLALRRWAPGPGPASLGLAHLTTILH